jgi:hypothetical protein
MIESHDYLLAARFAAIANPTDDSRWEDVLQRAGSSGARLQREGNRMLTRRRLVLAFVVVAAVLVPLGALGAVNDWWFLGSAGTPVPVSAPSVITEGEWSGHPWQLVAYASETDGVCFGVVPSGSKTTGAGAGMACGTFAGVARTAHTKASPDMTITWVAAQGDGSFPAHIAGPVISSATQVEIKFVDGDVLRVSTVAAPAPLSAVRFYAAPLPAAVVRSFTPAQPLVRTLAGLDAKGNVVACLAPQTAVSGVSPLSDCRP